jgi:hypothetical protein
VDTLENKYPVHFVSFGPPWVMMDKQFDKKLAWRHNPHSEPIIIIVLTKIPRTGGSFIKTVSLKKGDFWFRY